MSVRSRLPPAGQRAAAPGQISLVIGEIVALTMTTVAIVSGGCGTGKSETLRAMHGAFEGTLADVAVLETDHFYTMIDPGWSIPWPEAQRYFDLARNAVAYTAVGYANAGIEWIAIGSNGLCEEDTVREFACSFDRSRNVRVHHFTLDPGTAVVQQRMAERIAEHGFAVDEKKSPEWVEGQLEWFRKRYGAWTHVIDNSELTPHQTALAMFEAARAGAGRLI